MALVSLQMVYTVDYAVLAVVFWAAVGSILIARGIAKNKQRQQQTQQQTVIVNNYATPAPAVRRQTVSAPAPAATIRTSRPPVRASVSVGYAEVFAVAGVTFRNEDGTSRQEILRDICGGLEDGEADAWIEEYDYKGEQAIHVMTELGCVGNIRRTDIDDVSRYLISPPTSMTVSVETFISDDVREIYRADVIIDG